MAVGEDDSVGGAEDSAGCLVGQVIGDEKDVFLKLTLGNLVAQLVFVSQGSIWMTSAQRKEANIGEFATKPVDHFDQPEGPLVREEKAESSEYGSASKSSGGPDLSRHDSRRTSCTLAHDADILRKTDLAEETSISVLVDDQAVGALQSLADVRQAYDLAVPVDILRSVECYDHAPAAELSIDKCGESFQVEKIKIELDVQDVWI
jgi:hypothetical protein